MKGWHRDNYRHSLAARGFSRFSSKIMPGHYARLAMNMDSGEKKFRMVNNPDSVSLFTLKLWVDDKDEEIRMMAKDLLNSRVKNTDVDPSVVEMVQNKSFAGINNDVGSYLNDNLRSNNDGDKLTAFWRGTSHTLFSPMDDLDKDWLSFNQAAGNNIELSEIPVERASERGAALFGRVLTLGNVEPLIDHEEGRSFRDSMIDIEFGRRLD